MSSGRSKVLPALGGGDSGTVLRVSLSIDPRDRHCADAGLNLSNILVRCVELSALVNQRFSLSVRSSGSRGFRAAIGQLDERAGTKDSIAHEYRQFLP